MEFKDCKDHFPNESKVEIVYKPKPTLFLRRRTYLIIRHCDKPMLRVKRVEVKTCSNCRGRGVDSSDPHRFAQCVECGEINLICEDY